MRSTLFRVLCLGVLTLLDAHPKVSGEDDANQLAKDHEAAQKLQAIEKQILELVSKLKPSVVCIEAGGGSGSGVIVSADGLVLTAAHVIGDAKELAIVYPDGRRFRGEALGTYGPADAGMARILEGGPHPFVEVNDGSSFQLNDFVIALGHPGGFDIQRGPPLRIGHITAIETNFIETDAALIGGDSGGPTFDLMGRVIGIHSHISGAIQVNKDSHIGQFHANWDKMVSGVHHPIHFSKSVGDGGIQDPLILGLKLMDTAANNGLIVDAVVPNTPAAASGILVNDVLRTVNGENVGRASTFLQSLAAGMWGEQLKIQLDREGKPQTVNVELMYQSEYDGKGPSPQRGKLSQKQAPASESLGKREENEIPAYKSDSKQPSRLQELAAEAKANDGKAKLSRDELRTFRESLAKRTELHVPEGGTRLLDRWSEIWQDMSRLIGKSLMPSVFKLQSGGRPVGLATCVHRDGWFLAKASEVKNRDLQIVVSGQPSIKAEVVDVDDAIDIALLRVEQGTWQPISWNSWYSQSTPNPMGTLCIAIGSSSRPAGFGIVSVAARPLDGKTGVSLGIKVEQSQNSVRVVSIRPRSPALRAGVKVGDTILSIDQRPVTSEQQILDIVQTKIDGETVRLEIERGDAVLTIAIELENSLPVAPMPGAREQALDSVTANLSRRRWGFEEGIQHDCAISSRDVGGPLIDLKGQILGINIARAGRIHSYAIPSSRILKFLAAKNRFEIPHDLLTEINQIGKGVKP